MTVKELLDCLNAFADSGIEDNDVYFELDGRLVEVKALDLDDDGDVILYD